MRAALLVLVLGLAGCAVSEQECTHRCAVAGKRVEVWVPGFAGQCFCEDPVARSAAARFCESCANHCAPLKAITCKFGNDTWGAGPDVCECERKP